MLFGLALILLFGLVTSKILGKLGMPVMLGFIFTGVLLGPYAANILHPDLLRISGDLRMLALVIILLRAGLGISREAVNQVGRVALRMSFLPCLLEGATVTFVANRLLGLPLLEAGMLGFVLAAVSPAVVVPAMLQLMEKGLGGDKKIPVIILGGASLDDVFAITILTSLLSAAVGSTTRPIYWQTLVVPLQIAGGVVLGGLIGFLLVKLLRHKHLGASYADQVILTLGAGIVVALLGEALGVAGLLAVMTTGFVILEKAPEVATGLSERLKKIWLPAEIFLFTLIGAAVDFRLAGETGASAPRLLATLSAPSLSPQFETDD